MFMTDPYIKYKAKFDQSLRSCPISNQAAVLFAAHKFCLVSQRVLSHLPINVGCQTDSLGLANYQVVATRMRLATHISVTNTRETYFRQRSGGQCIASEDASA